ncbi:hypothetical protein NOF04DRAFT_1361803 [Fusarium oxysporum II5]|nr:hypothetical protein NOF04DRAFT_1361803 [Fusarium oxysporum II5]
MSTSNRNRQELPKMNSKTRRSTTRSRTGCGRCVKVSRKCDEARPVCSRCRRLDFECVYEPRYIWKTGRVPEPAASDQALVSETTTPCSCPQRPTSPQLLEAFKTTGHKSLHWNIEGSSLVIAHILPMYESCPAIRAAVNAQMALSHDCCSISALSRLDDAVSQTREYIQFVETQHDETSAAMFAAMLFLSHVSMRAGYSWTWQLERMHSLVLTMPQGPERQQHLEVLGGLDMNVWIVGRKSAPLHIWATYCRGGEGVENVTGLPRRLLDLISLVSRREDVSHELQQYADALPQAHDTMTGVYRSFILSARIYLQKEPIVTLLTELFTLVRCLRQEIPGTDLGILSFPAYTLGYHGELLEYRTLAVDVLSAPSTTYLPDGTSVLRGSPLNAMRSYWASIGVLDRSLAGGCGDSEVGLW